jgi:hypothetical protein
MRRASVAFEAADGFELGLALGLFASEIGTSFGVGLGAGERDDVDRAVELAVAAAVQAWRWVLPLEAGTGAVPACRAKCPSVGNRWAPAVRPMMIAAVTVPHPG